MTTDRRFCASVPSIAFAVMLALVSGTEASAHRMDEYLQASRISVGPDVVDVYLDLTPGIAVAESVIRMIDRDRDERMTSGEEAAYARDVGGDLNLELDGAPLRLELRSSDVPEPSTFRLGEGTLRLHLQASLPYVRTGAHALLFRNKHHAVDGVYLANALVPEDARVQVTGQRRNSDQSELTIDYSLRRSAGSTLAPIAVSLIATVLTVLFIRRRRTS